MSQAKIERRTVSAAAKKKPKPVVFPTDVLRPEDLHTRLTKSIDAVVIRLNDKQCQAYRSRLYGLNKDNAFYRFRTVRDGSHLIVWRMDKKYRG